MHMELYFLICSLTLRTEIDIHWNVPPAALTSRAPRAGSYVWFQWRVYIYIYPTTAHGTRFYAGRAAHHPIQVHPRVGNMLFV